LGDIERLLTGTHFLSLLSLSFSLSLCAGCSQLHVQRSQVHPSPRNSLCLSEARAPAGRPLGGALYGGGRPAGQRGAGGQRLLPLPLRVRGGAGAVGAPGRGSSRRRRRRRGSEAAAGGKGKGGGGGGRGVATSHHPRWQGVREVWDAHRHLCGHGSRHQQGWHTYTYTYTGQARQPIERRCGQAPPVPHQYHTMHIYIL
jgi:hypothetical protein